MGVETCVEYNDHVREAITSFHAGGETVAIIGRGRNIEEQSLVLVEKGAYFGFGFFDKQNSISDLESAKTYVKKSIETPTVQTLITGYVKNPRGAEVVVFN
jgi:DNA polymerase-3 subunit epsilon